MGRMIGAMGRGRRAMVRGNRAINRTAANQFRQGRALGARAFPAGSRRRGIAIGNTARGRRMRAGAAIGAGGILGANAVLAPRPPSSGTNGLQPRNSGGQGLY